MTTCYKVATRTHKDIESQSFESYSALDPYNVEYKIGEEVVPNIKGTPLFVFDTLDNARGFDFVSPILECEYDKLFDVQGISHSSMFFESLSEEDMAKFWNECRNYPCLDESLRCVPVGTLLVCSLRVIREIKDGD
jgi:hypothetical protein